jgi:hypothetical protein
VNRWERAEDVAEGIIWSDVKDILSPRDLVGAILLCANSNTPDHVGEDYDPANVPLRKLDKSEGSAIAIWESQHDNFGPWIFRFGVLLCCRPGAQLGTCAIQCCVGPDSNVQAAQTASADAPIPRFVNPWPYSPAFSIVPHTIDDAPVRAGKSDSPRIQ